ncbi:MAG: ABC transporter substrate-binding protein [Ardenticatenaceae bacterium]|nr:ABC transporter substrate-binding protein [Ardenticatenaceae bacterium]MCB8991390.1 ABC transporter substrate-binding protein [Ardenticatenaceae bacterium]MCB9003820.1 ABC transporter substrate-binding protein [Ardenticatenaceae bacterium]
MGQSESVATPTAVSFTTSTPHDAILTVGLATDSIVTLDPAAYSDRTTETVIRNIFDGLVTRTVDNQVVPELAQSYRWLDDTTVEFKLKQNVQFHNGDPFTAVDVAFTFDRLLNQDIGAPRRVFVQGIERVEMIDDYTVRFHLNQPWPVFLQLLVHTQVVPQGYVTAVGDAAFAQHPIGTGPFRFTSGKLDDEIVLTRFDNYYGGADELLPVGPPLLAGVVFRMMPNTTERLQALQTGEVQIIQNVPPTAVPILLDNPNLTIKTVVGTRPKFIDLNVSRPPFDDIRVRQAMGYAIDTEALLQEIANGYGILMAGPFSPANQFADPTRFPGNYDPQRAQVLLAEAGYAPADIVFTLDTTEANEALAEAIAAQLNGLGMQVEVKTWEYDVIKPQLLACQRQAFVHDWGDSAFDPVGYVEAKWQTQQPGTSAGRGNYACYSNARVDALIDEGAVASDQQQRQGIYNEVQQLIQVDAPTIFLYVPQEVEAASSRVHNWQPSPDGRINLHDVWMTDTE